MRILLIEPCYNWPPNYQPWSPWGKMQIAGYLRQRGHEVGLINNALLHLTDDTLRTRIDEFKPDVIGIGGMTMQCTDSLRIGMLCKRMYEDSKPRPLLVAGGVHFTFKPEDAYPIFDVVVIGEGEQTMFEICERFKDCGKTWGATSFQDIKGVHYWGYGEWLKNEPREYLSPDQLPMPAFDLAPWTPDYGDGFITGEKVPMLMTGRGCPFDCEFCAAPQLYNQRTRLFPMPMVKDIMEHFKRTHGVPGFRIMDDTFAVSNARVHEFCSMVQGSSLLRGMRFTCLTHCKTADRATMRLMKDTGFWIVAYGIESGNDNILKIINKKVTVSEAAAAIKTAREAGLYVEGLFMLANMGETEATILDTIRFAKTYNPPNFAVKAGWNYFQFATPFPGSRFYDKYAQYGTLITKDYDRYHHNEPIFIPHGLTAQRLVELRAQAFKEVSL